MKLEFLYRNHQNSPLISCCFYDPIVKRQVIECESFHKFAFQNQSQLEKAQISAVFHISIKLFQFCSKHTLITGRSMVKGSNGWFLFE